MSLNVGPVCASCGRYPGGSISCTKCFKICCPACFNDLVNVLVKSAEAAKIDMALLTERICRKCSEDGNGATDCKDQGIGSGITETAQELCHLHGKVCKLFCLDCTESMCGSCVDLGQHDLHRVDSLAVVYRAKSSQVAAKLTQATKLNDERLTETITYEKNLELLEKEEDLVLKEIEAMVQSSKLQVTQLTTVRKETLRGKLNAPTANKATLTGLRNKLEQLSKTEFLQQMPEIDKKCEKLIGLQNGIVLQKMDDICCDLIPSYQCRRIVFPCFWDAENDATHVVSLETAYDFEWKFTLRKSVMIQVQSNPSDPKVLKFFHTLVVIIPHPDFSKRIHRVFDLVGPNNTFDAVKLSHLKEQGFGNAHGDLVIMIGVRPLNVIIEKQLLSHHVEKLASKPEKFDHAHLIMHFNPKLSELQDNVWLKSLQVRDEEDHEWRLMIILRSGFVKANVELFKGSAASANYFIELKHTSPEKNILKIASCVRCFNTSTLWGFREFIRWDKLNENVGFHPDGILHFRFGVRPVPNDRSNPVSCTANA